MPRIVLKELESDKTHSVADLEATLGRDPACGIVIEGPKSRVVSGRHARVFFQDNAWWIEDTSRNGTVLDNERLQAAQRHAVRVGQVIGLGESGPRLRVAVLESRKAAETLVELPDSQRSSSAPPKSTTAPRQAASPLPKPLDEPAYPDDTGTIRRSEAQRAGVRFEEPTEPMSPAPDWLVQVVLRATSSPHRFDVTALVVKLGRSPDCNVQIPPELGASVSRKHAEILIEDGGVVVRDAGSRNGTFVNGKRIDGAHPAAKNDLIMLGSGGPTLAIDDLHIVKGQTTQAKTGAGGDGEPTPADGRPVTDASDRLVEPRTDPSPLAKGVANALGTAFLKDVLEDVSEKSARRMRLIVWSSVAGTVALAVAALTLTQWRVAASERLISGEPLESRGASLNAQLASGDSARRIAEQERDRLRGEVSRASGGAVPGATLDSLQRVLKSAEDRADDVASRVRVVRESNLAQVVQLNQGAVGLLVSFIGERAVSGSGFVITPSGYFVTNRQVVVDDSGKVRDTIYVTMADERFSLAHRIQVVALGNRDLDIAVAKIPDYRGPYMKEVDWNASGANQGEAAALIGFPFGAEFTRDKTPATVVRPFVSVGVFGRVAPDRIQFDGFTVGGSMGSPILNAAGAVVAVHRAGVSAGPGFGLSIPVSRVVSLLPPDARSELRIR